MGGILRWRQDSFPSITEPIGLLTAESAFSLRSDPTASKPSYLGSITDALTGIKTYRITTTGSPMNAGSLVKPRYAKLPAFTADGAKIHLCAVYNDAPVINASTLAFINRRIIGDSPRLAKNLSTPDRIYTMYDDGAGYVELRYQNLGDADDSFNTTVHDFGADGYTYVNIGGDEGSQSIDDRYWPMYGIRDDDGTADFFIYDKTADTLSAKFNVPAGVVEHCAISPDGAYMVVSIDGSGGGLGQGIHVFNSSMVFQRTLTTQSGSHGDIAVDSDGNYRWVWGKGTTAANTALTSSRLDISSERTEIPAPWDSNNHIGYTNYRCPGWILISTFDLDPTNYKIRGWNEIYFAKLDGSGDIKRVSYVYHPSNGSSTENSEAYAVSNPEGTQVVHGSVWHDGDPATDPVETYLSQLA